MNLTAPPPPSYTLMHRNSWKILNFFFSKVQINYKMNLKVGSFLNILIILKNCFCTVFNPSSFFIRGVHQRGGLHILTKYLTKTENDSIGVTGVQLLWEKISKKKNNRKKKIGGKFSKWHGFLTNFRVQKKIKSIFSLQNYAL